MASQLPPGTRTPTTTAERVRLFPPEIAYPSEQVRRSKVCAGNVFFTFGMLVLAAGIAGICLKDRDWAKWPAGAAYGVTAAGGLFVLNGFGRLCYWRQSAYEGRRQEDYVDCYNQAEAQVWNLERLVSHRNFERVYHASVALLEGQGYGPAYNWNGKLWSFGPFHDRMLPLRDQALQIRERKLADKEKHLDSVSGKLQQSMSGKGKKDTPPRLSPKVPPAADAAAGDDPVAQLRAALSADFDAQFLNPDKGQAAAQLAVLMGDGYVPTEDQHHRHQQLLTELDPTHVVRPFVAAASAGAAPAEDPDWEKEFVARLEAVEKRLPTISDAGERLELVQPLLDDFGFLFPEPPAKLQARYNALQAVERAARGLPDPKESDSAAAASSQAPIPVVISSSEAPKSSEAPRSAAKSRAERPPRLESPRDLEVLAIASSVCLEATPGAGHPVTRAVITAQVKRLAGALKVYLNGTDSSVPLAIPPGLAASIEWYINGMEDMQLSCGALSPLAIKEVMESTKMAQDALRRVIRCAAWDEVAIAVGMIRDECRVPIPPKNKDGTDFVSPVFMAEPVVEAICKKGYETGAHGLFLFINGGWDPNSIRALNPEEFVTE